MEVSLYNHGFDVGDSCTPVTKFPYSQWLKASVELAHLYTIGAHASQSSWFNAPTYTGQGFRFDPKFEHTCKWDMCLHELG